MAGLEDLIMLQQLEQRQNPLYALAQGIGQGIQEEQAKMKAKKEEEEQFKKSLKMIDDFNSTNSGKIGKIIPSLSMKDNKISLGFETEKPVSVKEQEMLRIREENMKINQEREKRLLSANKLRAAQQLGGILNREELENVNKELGFDIGTEMDSGRIQPVTIDGEEKYRILSNTEFEKNTDIINKAKEQESKLNIIVGDIKDVFKKYDAVDPTLKGAFGGRVLAGPNAFLNNVGVQDFDKSKNGILGLIARGVMSEVGVLTDQDIERVKAWLPKLSDSPEVRQQNENSIMSLITRRLQENQRRMSTGIGDSKKPQGKYSNLW